MKDQFRVSVCVKFYEEVVWYQISGLDRLLSITRNEGHRTQNKISPLSVHILTCKVKRVRHTKIIY